MLASITPLGQRGRAASWRRTVTAYAVASTVGGAAVGALLGLTGWLLGVGGTSRVTIVVGVLALAAAASDLRGRPPTIRRQVDETWLTRYRDWVVGTGFGLQLGVGALTIVTSASLYLTWAAEVALGRPGWSALVGATFGLARALPLLSVRTAIDATTLRRLLRGWQAWAVPMRRLTVGVQAAAAAVLLAAVR